MSAITDKIISIATAEIGTKEEPANSNLQKYGTWYGMNGVSWCGIFVSWVYNEAGCPLGHIDTDKGFHYMPSAYNHWKQAGEITTDPQPGDLVLFSWKGDGFCNHVGIFVRWIVKGKAFETVEGNTSGTNDSNGGEVEHKPLRNIKFVQAFVHPKCLDENPVT